MPEDEKKGVLSAAAAGAVAGIAGGLALIIAERLKRAVLLPRGSDATPTAQRAVESIAKDHGAQLEGAPAMAAGAAAQLAYCALWGAVYGATLGRTDTPSLVDGLVLGGLAYAATSVDGGLLPRLGVAPPPTEQAMEKAMVPVGSHLAFGLTTVALFDAAA
jgi:hypothetical protein